MRHKIKSLSIALMTVLCMFLMTACGSDKAGSDGNVDATLKQSLESTEEGLLGTMGSLSDSDIENYLASGDDFTVSAMNTWKDNKEELGAFKEVKESEVVLKDGAYQVTSLVAFEKTDGTVTMNVDATGTPTYMNIEVKYSLGKLMERAALNTVMGICIVFLMLLMLSGLISLFKHIGKAGKKNPAVQPLEESAPQPALAPARAVAEENPVDDGELAAVIAAAIAASENTSTDSFVVRSIKRKTNNKWQRA